MGFAVILNAMWSKCIPAGVAVFAFLATTACVEDGDFKTRHESTSVDVGKAESVRAEIDMGAGELNVGGDAPKLLEANFTYSNPDWKPEVKYNGASFRGLLTIRQDTHGGGIHLGNNEYKWDLRFNDNIPLDILVNCGAGEGNLDLAHLTIRSLDVNMGVGRVEAELPSEPKR